MSDQNATTRHSGTLYRLFVLGLVVANCWVQYSLWFGDQGMVLWRQTQRQLLLVQEEIGLIKDRIRHLKREIVLVEKEPMVLEEVARRDLGLVYPDEILFVFPDDKKK